MIALEAFEWSSVLDDALANLLLALVVLALWGLYQYASRRRQVGMAWDEDLWDRAPFGIALLDWDNSRWLRINPEVERITGYTSSDLTSGMTWMDVTTEDTVDMDMNEVHRLRRGEQSRYSCNKAYTRKDGSRIEVRLTVTKAEIGRRLFFMVYIEDRSAEIRRLAATEKELKSCIERQGRLAETLDFERTRSATMLRQQVASIAPPRPSEGEPENEDDD